MDGRVFLSFVRNCSTLHEEWEGHQKVARAKITQALTDVINARLGVLAATESLRVLTRLDVGDRVRINHHARPLYLQGRTATVIGQESGKVVVKLDHPTGRFVTGEVRCPPLVLDQLPK